MRSIPLLIVSICLAANTASAGIEVVVRERPMHHTTVVVEEENCAGPFALWIPSQWVWRGGWCWVRGHWRR